MKRASKTAPIYLSFALAVSGCASQMVKYRDVTTLDRETCLETTTALYTTERELKQAKKDQKEPDILTSERTGSSFHAGCAEHESDMALQAAYAEIMTAKLQSSANLLVTLFNSSSITPEQKMEAWRDIRANLHSQNPDLRDAQESALADQGLRRELFLAACPPAVIANENGRNIYIVNLGECSYEPAVGQ